jgi:hypothetical protein
MQMSPDAEVLLSDDEEINGTHACLGPEEYYADKNGELMTQEDVAEAGLLPEEYQEVVVL